MSSSASIYMKERKRQQEIDIQTAKVANAIDASSEIVQPNLANTKDIEVFDLE
jgi:hypothetical protein